LICFAGIGNPENFFNLLKANRLNVIKEIKFPDHYNYSDDDLENLLKIEEKYNGKLVTTEKDFLRISKFKRKRFSFIPIKVNIDREEEFLKHLSKILK
jgi:Tetraacyldisaccharide-1-P 4''-kinase